MRSCYGALPRTLEEFSGNKRVRSLRGTPRQRPDAFGVATTPHVAAVDINLTVPSWSRALARHGDEGGLVVTRILRRLTEADIWLVTLP